MSCSHFRRPLSVVRRASTGPRAQQGIKPGVVCAHTGADHTGVSGNRGIPAGAGQSVRNVPVSPEPSHASCVGRNHPNVIQGDQMPDTMLLNRPLLKCNLQQELVSINVQNNIDAQMHLTPQLV